MKKINIETIGADIELFLFDEVKKEVVSAEGYIKGSKYDPFVFDENSQWFTTSLDNVLAEFTIPPAKSVDEFAKSIAKSINYIKSILPKRLSPIALPAASLDEKYLMTEQAQLFGCEPDFNAYEREINPRPFCEDYTLRSAGGHLHLGFNDVEIPLDNYDITNDEQRCSLVKMLDLFISIPLVIIEPDNKRKELYGKPGAFRPKEYGLEYRTPSNYYLTSKELIQKVYLSVYNAVEYLNSKGALSNEMEQLVRNTINTNNKTEANKLINQFDLILAK